jgi:hypothetical protein
VPQDRNESDPLELPQEYISPDGARSVLRYTISTPVLGGTPQPGTEENPIVLVDDASSADPYETLDQVEYYHSEDASPEDEDDDLYGSESEYSDAPLEEGWANNLTAEERREVIKKVLGRRHGWLPSFREEAENLKLWKEYSSVCLPCTRAYLLLIFTYRAWKMSSTRA